MNLLFGIGSKPSTFAANLHLMKNTLFLLSGLLLCISSGNLWAQKTKKSTGKKDAELQKLYPESQKSKVNAGEKPTSEIPKPTTKKDRLTYAIASNIARQFTNQKIEINPDLFVKSFADIYNGGKPLMSDEEIMTTLQKFEEEMRNKMQSDAKSSAEPNKMAGRKFLEENKKKPGVVELPSRLQYEIIKDGTGESPKATSTVTTHYTGTLIDGTVFDSSVERGQPAQFPVNGVIKGWTEALQLMKPGSKWRLYIPSDLAYGDGGSPPKIQPGATLIFEVELISVDK